MDTYEIRVKGNLDTEWSEWLGGMTITQQADGINVLTGPVVDQSALQGVLLKLHDLGLALISVQCVEQAAGQNDEYIETLEA